MVCSPSWWVVSCWSKFAQAVSSWCARFRSPAGNLASAVMNRSRSLRTAAWITLFMLISAMPRL